jgi:hypothetical protein
VTLAASVAGDARPDEITDRQAAAILAAGILAMMPLVERAADRAMSISVESVRPDAMTVEMLQSTVPVSKLLAQHFFAAEAGAMMPGDPTAALGALAISAFVQRYGGQASMELPDDGGSRIRIVLARSR